MSPRRSVLFVPSTPAGGPPRPLGAGRPPAGPARRRRRAGASGAVGLVALLALPSGALAGPCADADAVPAAVGILRATEAVGCLVDHERADAGLGPLAHDEGVRRASQHHAEDMAARRYFGHVTPEGVSPGTRMLAAGFVWSDAGENIAAGQPTPRDVVAAWLASPPHCHALLAPQYAVAGYGLTTGAGGPYWVQGLARPALAGPVPTTPPAGCPRQATKSESHATPPVPDAPAARGAVTPTVSASRRGRRLVVLIVLPGAGATVAALVRVRQGGRTVRTSRIRRPGGAPQRLTVRLPRAGGGDVLLRAGSGRSVRARFR